MELIEVIYSILLYGGGIILTVIIFSFIISKMRKENLPSGEYFEPVLISESRTKPLINHKENIAGFVKSQTLVQFEQNEIRKRTNQPPPQIFQIDQIKPREVKIVRKSTYNPHQDRNLDFEKKFGINSRYTIVNEEFRNSKKNKAMNFYL